MQRAWAHRSMRMHVSARVGNEAHRYCHQLDGGKAAAGAPCFYMIDRPHASLTAGAAVQGPPRTWFVSTSA